MLRLILSCLLYISVGLAAHLGVERSDARIIGGNATDIIDHPYHVGIEYLGSYRCGGAIIARKWILSGASCIEMLQPESYRVRVGTSYLGTGGNLLNVSKIVPHYNYSPVNDNYDYDIALFQLKNPVPLSVSAQIIGLPKSADHIVAGAVGTVTGWGFTDEENDGPSTVLQAVDVPLMSLAVCKALYESTPYYVSDRMFCAGLFEGGKDACNGDGGGPLVINNQLSGIVSWGLGCGRPQLPGVYTNVGLLRDWVIGQTGI